MDTDIHAAYLSARRIPINAYATTERAKTLQMFLIPRCLMTMFLKGARSPRDAWVELRQQSRTLRILEACALLWVWLHICILTDRDNLQGMEYQFSTLPIPSHVPTLLDQRF